MRREEVRDALDALASDVPAPSSDAPAAIARGNGRIKQRRRTLAGTVATLVVIVLVAGAIASSDGDGGDSPNVSSVPTTGRSITVQQPFNGPVTIPMAFVSPTEGWICSGAQLQYTTDAGATWKTVIVPFGPPLAPRVQHPVCAAVDGGEAWVLTSATVGNGLEVIHVSDGGRNVETSPFPPVGSDWTVRELSFADSEHGWAFLRSAGGGAIASYVTTDGGRTWESETPIRHAPLWESPTVGWAMLELPPGGHLTRTTDGGRTWEQFEMSDFSNAVQPIAANGDSFIALGSTGNGRQSRPWLAVTRSRGGHWEMRRAPSDVVTSDTMPAAASALDGAHYWLGAASRLYAASDGGRGWTLLADFAGVSQITDVHFLTPEIGFVAAIGSGDAFNSTLVLRTADGGGSWTTAAVHTPALTRAAQVVNTPGGIVGCPTKPLTAPPPGDPPAGLIEAATEHVGRGPNAWAPSTVQAYRLGTNPPNSFGQVFKFQVGSCGPVTMATGWVVEMRGPAIKGRADIPRANLALAHATDGWHVFGRYP